MVSKLQNLAMDLKMLKKNKILILNKYTNFASFKREYWSYQANLVARKVFSKINKKYCMVQTCKNMGVINGQISICYQHRRKLIWWLVKIIIKVKKVRSIALK